MVDGDKDGLNDPIMIILQRDPRAQRSDAASGVGVRGTIALERSAAKPDDDEMTFSRFRINDARSSTPLKVPLLFCKLIDSMLLMVVRGRVRKRETRRIGVA